MERPVGPRDLARIQLVYGKGKVTGVRATSGSGLGDICIHAYGQGRAAAVTVISGKDSDAPKQGWKKNPLHISDKEMDEKHTAVIARRWYWQLCGEYCTLTASGPGKPAINWLGSVKITGSGEEARGLRFQRGRSTTRVNSPSLKTHGKTKLHIPMSAVKEKKEGKMGDLNVPGGNWD